MKFDCPHCSQNLEISDEWAGHAVDCPSCQQALTVPAVALAIPVRPEVPKPPANPQPPGSRRPAPGSSTPSKPPRRGGGGFAKFLLTLLVLAGAGFGYAMVHFDESPQQVWKRLIEFVETLTKPAPVPTPTPSPTPSPTPTPTPTPSPTPESTPSPTSTPNPISWLMGSKERWPSQVALRVPVEFPVIIAGRNAGSMQIPAGTLVKLVQINPKGIIVEYQTGRASMPIEASDLPMRAEASMAKAMQSGDVSANQSKEGAVPGSSSSPEPKQNPQGSARDPSRDNAWGRIFRPAGVGKSQPAGTPYPWRVKLEHTPKSKLLTSFKPTVTETRSSKSGLLHPGIIMTKAQLDTMQFHVRENDQPWAAAFEAFSNNQRSRLSPRVFYSSTWTDIPHGGSGQMGNVITFRMAMDGDTAFHQIIMWYVTGNELYRLNALGILRDYFSIKAVSPHHDSQIRWGVASYKLCFAAEILRASQGNSPKSGWTADDEKQFSHLMEMGIPLVAGCYYWMNQHCISTMGLMATAIFLDDKKLYETAVERTTVNEQGQEGGINGSIKWQMRLVTENFQTKEKVNPPQVQLVEMVRDQGHAAINPIILSQLAETIFRQGTKVDPVTGKASDALDRVDIYSFLDDRLLAGSEYFSRYCWGETVTWIPIDKGDHISGEPRKWTGGILYNHYRFVKMWNPADERFRSITEGYEKSLPEWDGGTDFFGNGTLLFTPDNGIMK